MREKVVVEAIGQKARKGAAVGRPVMRRHDYYLGAAAFYKRHLVAVTQNNDLVAKRSQTHHNIRQRDYTETKPRRPRKDGDKGYYSKNVKGP